MEVDDKVFSKEEMDQIKGLDPDYVAHMIASPEELKRVVERYGISSLWVQRRPFFSL